MQQWPRGPLLGAAGGFREARGTIEVIVGYAVFADAVQIAAFLKVGPQPPVEWLNRWTSHIEALRAAESMCGEAMDCLDSYKNVPRRPVEDLDFDDFLEHLETRLNGNFH